MGVLLSNKGVILILAVFVVSILVVGLLAGLLGKEDCSKQDVVPTSPPTTAVPPTSLPGPVGPWQEPFLPDATTPLKYQLDLIPDFYNEGETFTGKIAIDILINSPTKYLIVHYKRQTIDEDLTKVTHDGTTLALKGQFAYDHNEFWVVELESELEAGTEVTLTLGWEASLADGIVGFYKISYTMYLGTDQEEKSWLASSKFQPTDARKAFPCFDEPKYKTPYVITIEHWTNFTALSNMPGIQSPGITAKPGWSRTVFEESYPMSSYLVCFVISDFEYKEKILNNGKPHRVWATKDKINQTIYALEVGTNVTNYFEELFHMEYHLPKLDQIAIPDFSSGAMEHWGLITYRETSLLYDPATVSSSGKERVAQVIAHELAHNYFGNVVTCKWWDEIWLNEGFARFYQYLGMGDYEKDWEADDYFVVRTQQGVMQADASKESRPVFEKVVHPDEINQAFDGIAYDKGASVLRLIRSFLGKTVFNTAIQQYLRVSENKTVETQDLWAVFANVTKNSNFAEIMDPWVYQMGLPVIKIEHLGDTEYKATPQRFLNNPAVDPTLPQTEYNYEWFTPLTWSKRTTDSTVAWINKTERTFNVEAGLTQPVKFNDGQVGYYRVNYEDEMWNKFAGKLKADVTSMQPIDRANLLDDALNLAMADQLSYGIVLNMTEYMTEEDHYFPWRSAYSSFNYITNVIYGEPDYHLWRKYVRDLSNKTMAIVGINGANFDDHLTNMLRLYMISVSANNGNQECLDDLGQLFLKWIEDPVANSVNPEITQEVYTYGMREEGREDAWDEMWTRYTKAESAQEQLYILKGLAQSPQRYLLERFLAYVLDPTKIKDQDFFTAVNYAASNPHGEAYVWRWMQENYEHIEKRFGTSNRYFGRMVPSIAQDFRTEFQLREVQAFYVKYPKAGAGSSARLQSIESIESNIEWRKKHMTTIFDWLKNWDARTT